MTVSSHTSAAADQLRNLTDCTERATEHLAELTAAPMGEPHKLAAARLRDTTRELRSYAAELAALAGASAAIR